MLVHEYIRVILSIHNETESEPVYIGIIYLELTSLEIQKPHN